MTEPKPTDLERLEAFEARMAQRREDAANEREQARRKAQQEADRAAERLRRGYIELSAQEGRR